MVEFIVGFWLAWCAVVIVMFMLGVVFAKPAHPQFNGFRIFVPDYCVRLLTEAELHAVVMHELGHKAHLHVWCNLLRLLFFVPMTKARRMKQELEADDYVIDSRSLASALRKISGHPFDLYRAARLDARAGAAPGARDAR